MARFRMPPPDVVIIDPNTGRLTADGYDLFKTLEKLRLIDMADFSPTAPTSAQVPIWNSTTGLWTPGTN